MGNMCYTYLAGSSKGRWKVENCRKKVSTGLERVDRASCVNGVGSETTGLGGGRYGLITANSVIRRLGKILAFCL